VGEGLAARVDVGGRDGGGVVKAARWVVKRTGEDAPDYAYRIVRRTADGDCEVYQYADTRAEADDLAKEANANLAVASHKYARKATQRSARVGAKSAASPRATRQRTASLSARSVR
jgi:hypothetical protein